MKPNNRAYLLVISVLASLAWPAIASAHAFLDHADPKVGATLNASPARITLYFTQQLEPAFSTITVLDADGKQVDNHDVKIDEKDPSIMTVSVSSLPAGTFKVEWKVTSVDTHKTHGSFNFTVQPKP